MVWQHYYYIRRHLTRLYQERYDAAKARGEETCPMTGKPLIDLSQKQFSVLAALSRKELLVRSSTNQSSEQFILAVWPDTRSAATKSVTTKTV
jgi:hypothetical protein